MNKLTSKYFLIIAFLIIISKSYLAQLEIKTLPEGLSFNQLDNGLQVLLIEKPSLPMVGINTVVKVGSAYENFSTSGMSHMLEHLLFNGTEELSQQELYDATDRIGGYNNANTSEYFTNFMMVTPAENIIDGMKLQADMLFNSVVPIDKFEKEKGIVLEEIAKSLAKPAEQIERNILSVIYNGHALSLSTLGTYETIKSMNRNDVFEFYKNYYVPNNMIVSVIGNFNSTEMLNNLKDIYGKIKPGVVKQNHNSDLNIAFNEIPQKNITPDVFHKFYNGENTQLQLFYNLPFTQNLVFFDLLNLSLESKTNEIKSLLNKQFDNIIDGIEFKTREFSIKNYLQVTILLNNPNKLDEIKKYFMSIFSDIKLGLAEETVNAETIKARTSFLQNTEKPHMFGIYNADKFAQYGIESILDSYSGDGYKEAAKVLNNFKFNDNPIILIQHPQIKSINNDNLQTELPVLFEYNDGRPTLIAKQTKGNDLLAIHFLIKNKAAYENKYGKKAAQILHETFGERMRNPEVQKRSSKFGFTFTVNDNPFIPMDDIYLSPQFGYIRVEGLADSLNEAIKFLTQQMYSFIPTLEEFNSAVEKTNMPSMMGHGNKAQKLFNLKLDNILYEEEKYKESSEEITYDNILEFSKLYFTPSNMIISVVSKEPADNLQNLFSDFKKELPENTVNETAFLKGFKNITSPIDLEMDGNGEQSYLYFGFQKTLENTDIAALQVLSLILSDKIVFDIREKQGMAYSMNAGIEMIKNKAMFYIKMGTRPENIDKLIPQLQKFFDINYIGEINNDLITKTINMYLGRMMFRRLSSINQAYYLGYSKYFNNDIFYDSKSLENLKNVTTDDVKKVMKKYLIIENPVKIIVR